MPARPQPEQQFPNTPQAGKASPEKNSEDYHALEDSGSRSAQSPLGTPSPGAQASMNATSLKQVAASTPDPIALAATPGSATASTATASNKHEGAAVRDSPQPMPAREAKEVAAAAAAATRGGPGCQRES